MLLLLAVAWAALAGAAPPAAESPRVTLEIFTRQGAGATAAQEWQQALSKLPLAGIRIQSDRGDAEAAVSQTGTKTAPSYRVVGILAADGRLYLPGGTFSVRDTGKLRKWLDELQASGAEGVTQPRSVFGLLPSQLQAVNDDLARPVGFATAELSAAAAMAQIGKSLRSPLALEPGASRELAAVKVPDELRDLSRGTALATLLRPAGLVLVPRASRGGSIEYRVGRPREGEDVWPVGWPPKGRASDALPGLFEMLNVEIQEIPVSEALAAIEGRLKVPFVYDRNAMALHRIDPTAVQADVPGKRISYSQVLRRVLGQAKLRYELRVDEAEHPFLWITTIQRAP
jgi:hypothetical protein